jgi:hypothetical protein
MAIVDDRGRVAGRVNLIDAIAAAFIVVLIPVAYGAYLLFRTPAARLAGIAPKIVYQGGADRIGISGRNLRPFMRVSFNTVQGRTFLIGSTDFAAVDLPELDPGVYDVVLFDYAQEIDRLPRALTVLAMSPQPTIDMEAGGAFLYIAPAGSITAGQKFPPTGDPVAEVISVQPPVPADLRVRAGEVTLGVPLPGQVKIPATIRVRCYASPHSDGTVGCTVQGPRAVANLAPDSVLTLAGPNGWVNFQVSEVHVARTPPVARARVSFVATPALVAKIKVGDTDSSAKTAARGYSARIVSIDGITAVAPLAPGRFARLAGDERVLSATLTVPIQQEIGGWTYRQRPFKIGAPFTFETAEYIVEGEVADVTWPSAAASPAPTGTGGTAR